MLSDEKEIYEFGPYRLDVGQHRFERSEGVTNGSLPEKAFQMLVFLVRNQGRLVTKNELLDAIWPDTAVEENNLNKSIHAIRHALGEKQGEQKYIETVPKHGYRFIAEVRREDGPISPTALENGSAEKIHDKPGNTGLHPPGLRDLSHDTPSPTQSNRLNRKATAVAGLIGALGFAGWLVMNRVQTSDTRPSSASTNSETPSSRNSTTDHSRSPAYDLYVRGKVRVASENREDTSAAIMDLEEAVAMDPNFAEAFAQLARAYNTMAFKYNSGAETKLFHEKAEVAIEKALELDPDLAEAHFARGLILWTNTKGFPHEQAIRSYKRSLELDPNLDETHHQLSLVYSHIGLLDEAHAEVRRALELNPNNTLARFRVGVYTTYQGKFDEAIAIFKTIPRDVTPLLVDRSIAEALIQTGHVDKAEKLVDEYLSRFPQDEGGSFTSVKALLLAKRGKAAEAEAAIARADQIGKGYGHFHHTAYNIAAAYAVMTKSEKSIEWLETAAENGFPNAVYFDIDPNLENIRSHPGFVRMMIDLRAQRRNFKALV